MSFPQPERTDPDKVEMDAAAPGQRSEGRPQSSLQEPRPVIPDRADERKAAEEIQRDN